MTGLHFFYSFPGSVLVGALFVILLFLMGRYRTTSGSIETQKIVAVFLLGAALHVFVVCVFNQFFFGVPVSKTIETYGDLRAAWLFVGVTADVALRLYLLYDPPDPNSSN